MEDWTEAEEPCPKCGSRTEEASWWDDTPEAGGACIGSRHRCTNPGCDWDDRR